MITINESNVKVDFLNEDLVHISLEQEGHFSTQLIRELRAISKINNGSVVKNCIVSNLKNLANETDLCRICKKADRMKEFMSVAVVCNNSCAASHFDSSQEISTSKSINVFQNYPDALAWFDNRIDSENRSLKTLKETLPTNEKCIYPMGNSVTVSHK